METGMPYLTKIEQDIIAAIAPAQRDRLNALYLPRLRDRKSDIIGLRCEDLFFFLDSLRHGELPTQGADMRAKTDAQLLYFTPNPESERAEAFRGHAPHPSANSFMAAATHTLDLYSESALLGPIAREVRPHIPDEPQLIAQWWAAVGQEECEINVQTELFYDKLAAEIQQGGNFYSKRRYSALYALAHHLPPERKSEVRTLFQNIKNRQSILVGFANTLLDAYGAPQLAEENDFGFLTQGKPVHIRHVVGFEALGDFEVSVLESILKK